MRSVKTARAKKAPIKTAYIKAICPHALFSCKILERAGFSGWFSGAHMSVCGQLNSLKGIIFAFILCFTLGSTALAGVAPSPCDPQCYDSLRSRAWLEAQREITQNQNLIFKPDSVLEYTCFDKHMNILAYEAQNMFSETQRWGEVLPDDSMDNALQNLVGAALGTYIAANFDHTFLGGRSTANYEPEGIAGAPGADYVCENMRDVWQESKCMDFAQNPDTDGFFTFENYASTDDKRTLPNPCAGIAGRWTDEIGLATVNDDTPWIENEVETFADLLDANECNDQTLKIATGITVQRSKATPTTYLEKVCLPPGCRYVPTGMNAGNCQQN